MNRKKNSAGCAAAARIASAISAALAVCSTVLLVALRAVHCFDPGLLPWDLKSAIPLIFAGVALAALQFATPRTRTQMALGLGAALAFILWGAEQYIPNLEMARVMDDLVVFLFVFDASAVVCGQLRPKAEAGGKKPHVEESEGLK